MPGLLGDKLPAKVATLPPMDMLARGADGQPVVGLPDGEQFRQDVFAADPGDIGQLAETPAHILYVLRVDQVAPPALQKVADRREAVLAAWTAAEQLKKLTEIAAGAEERANAESGELAAVATGLGLEGKTTPAAIGRDEVVADFSPALLAQIFATHRGKWTTGLGGDGASIVLARTKEVTTAAVSDPQLAEREARGAVTGDMANELAAAYQDAILKATKVEIDDTLFNQLKQRQP